MKKLFIPVIIIICFYACKKESTTKTTSIGVTSSLILGKWYFAQDTILEYTNGKLSRVVSELGAGTDPNYFDIYYKNGTAFFSNTSSDPSDTVTFKYSISGNKITHITPAVIENDGSGGTFTIPGSTEIATIKTLTSTQMELFFDDSSTDPDGTIIRTTEAAYYVKK